jgi:hypothetical protein
MSRKKLYRCFDHTRVMVTVTAAYRRAQLDSSIGQGTYAKNGVRTRDHKAMKTRSQKGVVARVQKAVHLVGDSAAATA